MCSYFVDYNIGFMFILSYYETIVTVEFLDKRDVDVHVCQVGPVFMDNLLIEQYLVAYFL